MGLFDIFGKKKNANNAKQTLPVQASEDVLQSCVDSLFLLYRDKSTGFYESEGEEVRKVGKKLNSAGGMELMLQAYNIFAKQRPECARNLESLWSGIGEWMG